MYVLNVSGKNCSKINTRETRREQTSTVTTKNTLYNLEVFVPVSFLLL
jgi:hypothetical protein